MPIKRTIIEQPVPKKPHYAKWENKEISKFNNGAYSYVSWYNKHWSRAGELRHYPHVDQTGTKIRFIMSMKNGEKSRYTLMKPGKYLTKYYGKILSKNMIQYWSERFIFENELPILRIAIEPLDIQRVYHKGPRSCMGGKINESGEDAGIHKTFNTHVHPTYVYGAGDLGVAYITNRGRIVARAIVNLKKKIAGRLYGDLSRLEKALKSQDFRILTATGISDRSRYTELYEGCRILKIQNWHTHHWIMPYLDGAIKMVEIPGDDKHFLLIKWSDKGKYKEYFSPESQYGLVHPLAYFCNVCETPSNDNHYDMVSEIIRRNGKMCHPCYNKIAEKSRVHRCKKCEKCLYDTDPQAPMFKQRVKRSGTAGNIMRFCPNCFENNTFSCLICDNIFSLYHKDGGTRIFLPKLSGVKSKLCGGCFNKTTGLTNTAVRNLKYLIKDFPSFEKNYQKAIGQSSGSSNTSSFTYNLNRIVFDEGRVDMGVTPGEDINPMEVPVETPIPPPNYRELVNQMTNRTNYRAALRSIRRGQ